MNQPSHKTEGVNRIQTMRFYPFVSNGKKKIMNQDFTTTDRSTIVAKSSLENFSKNRRFFLVSRILIVAILIASFNATHAQSYKETTGYLLKEVEPNAPHFFNRYKYGQIGSSYYNFNIVDEKSLLNFFLDDSVYFDQTVLLCDPAVVMFADSATSRDVRRFTRIKDILLLDDSEIYGIGGRKYFIRKIRYAYYDNTQVKVYIKGYNYYEWDDITSEDEAVLSEVYEVGQLYKRDYYQCYHHLVEILPTPPQISKYAWKKLYQLGEDKKMKNKMNPSAQPR